MAETIVRFALLLFLLAWRAQASQRPNILLILADDLGYGDLSVEPFLGQGIKTPELEKMAMESIIMANFHVAAPICTPTRASILTGLFPWRLGIYGIYGSGPQAKEHLAVVPNSPMTFLEAGYHTAHIGKWHLGGMSPHHVNKRRTKLLQVANATSTRTQCSISTPGPNQHGFAEYIAMEEGPGSTRLTVMQPKSCLYHKGTQHLLRNDNKYFATQEILTDRQATEAIRIMNETTAAGKNFYIHLWFDAPHGPWETIEPYDQWYKDKAWKSRNAKYATMVSSLDANIGRVRQAVNDMGIAENTIIVFLSDNGPENEAGSAGPFKGRKRSLNEGGIRVPCMWEWRGHFARNKRIDNFAVSTDLFPTFLHAAGIAKPASARIDGTSILNILLQNQNVPRYPGNSMLSGGTSTQIRSPGLTLGGNHSDPLFSASVILQHGDERVIMWHKNIAGASSAIWWKGYKLILGPKRVLEGIYDMRKDSTETTNIAGVETKKSSSSLSSVSSSAGLTSATVSSALDNARPLMSNLLQEKMQLKLASFDKFGHKAHAAHVLSKVNVSCFPPVASTVGPLPWDAAPATVPDY